MSKKSLRGLPADSGSFVFEVERGGRLRTVGCVQERVRLRRDEVRSCLLTTEYLARCAVADAYNKVVVVELLSREPEWLGAIEGRIAVLDPSTRRMPQIHCGHATAAGIAFLYWICSGRSVDITARREMRVDGNTAYEISASVEGETSSLYSVIMRLAIESKWCIMRERRGVIHANVFNPTYVAFDPDERMGAILRERPVAMIRRRTIVIRSNGDIPSAEFYNSNGLHGSAPLTGLATLSIIRHLGGCPEWFRRATRIRTRSGTEELMECGSSQGRVPSRIVMTIPTMKVSFWRPAYE